jgi:hypothetical protein
VAALVKPFFLSSSPRAIFVPVEGPTGGVLDLCWRLRDPWSSLAPNDLLSVLTSMGHAPDPACALGACAARGGPPLLIIGSPCAPVPRNALPTPAPNRWPAPRDLGARWDDLARPLRLAHGSRWHLPWLPEAPECDESLPGQRHNPDCPQARTPLAQPGLLPLRQRALRLQADPAPRHLSGHRPHRALAGLGDPEFPAALATLVGFFGENAKFWAVV